MPPSKQALINQQTQASTLIQEGRASYTAATAMLLVMTMLELAEGDPRIVGFELDAMFETDDEGGFFWSDSYYGLDAQGERLDEGDFPDDIFEKLRDCGAEEDSALLVFGSAYDAKVTVAELRAQLEPARA